MRPVYLLDTNIISENAKKMPNEAVQKQMYANIDLSAISSITWQEAVYGVNHLSEGKRKTELLHYLEDVIHPVYDIIPYDEHAAFIYGNIRVQMESKGVCVDENDLQIAAVAIANNMILVTRNTRHFEQIPGLMVEDWFV